LAEHSASRATRSLARCATGRLTKVVKCATYIRMGYLSTLLKNRGLRLIDLARAVPVDKATASRWDRKGVPANRVQAVQKATGIPAHDLRPDLASIFSEKESNEDAA